MAIDFPAINISSEGAPDEFITSVKEAVNSFSYKQLYNWLQVLFRRQKKQGFTSAINLFYEIRRDGLERDSDGLTNVSVDSIYLLLSSKEQFANLYIFQIGNTIFEKIPSDIRRKYCPMCDFRVEPAGDFGQDFIVRLSSLDKIEGKNWYCSPVRPKIDINGQTKVLVYSSELIVQMGAVLPWGKNSAERFMPLWEDYFGLGDFHGFLYGCISYEQCEDLYNPNDLPHFFGPVFMRVFPSS